MTEWEYRKLALNNHRPSGDEVDLLNDAGMDGWELVGITSNHIAYLKRRILFDARQNSSASSARTDRTNLPVSVEAKYRDPATNETWSGRGRMANRLKRKQEAGEDIDKYLV